jgi:hypothetical protein
MATVVPAGTSVAICVDQSPPLPYNGTHVDFAKP